MSVVSLKPYKRYNIKNREAINKKNLEYYYKNKDKFNNIEMKT